MEKGHDDVLVNIDRYSPKHKKGHGKALTGTEKFIDNIVFFCYHTFLYLMYKQYQSMEKLNEFCRFISRNFVRGKSPEKECLPRMCKR
jgi:hypothetical protein